MIKTLTSSYDWGAGGIILRPGTPLSNDAICLLVVIIQELKGKKERGREGEKEGRRTGK